MDVGEQVPDFESIDHRGARFVLSEACGRGPVVVFFYPRDETSVCTREACAFQSSMAELHGLGATLVGVSGDSLDSHRRFAEHHALQYPLLSDADGALRRAFGVRRRMLLLPARETYALDENRVVRSVVRDLLSHDRHLELTLQTLRALRGPPPP